MKLLGHLRDPLGTGRGEEIRRLVGAGPVPSSCSLAAHLPTVLDQRGGSCVGAALRSALMIAASVGGWSLDPSYLAIYALARELEAPKNTMLPDFGCYPHRALEALEDWGVVARSRWPDDANLEGPVPQDVLEAGASALVTGVYRIEETGAARVEAIKRAICEGHAVFFGMSVDDAYMAWGPDRGTYLGRVGDDRGGHAQVITAYVPGRVGVLGSWGTRWARNGFIWIADDWIADGDCYDFTVLTTAPREVR